MGGQRASSLLFRHLPVKDAPLRPRLVQRTKIFARGDDPVT
jgi:hypothetical protein